MGRIELPTSPLPRECSATELHGPWTYTNKPTKTGAGEGNRTLVLSLEGFSSTIELHPLRPARTAIKLVVGEGFEPSKAEPSDLQSDPFDRSGIPPEERRIISIPARGVNALQRFFAGKIIRPDTEGFLHWPGKRMLACYPAACVMCQGAITEDKARSSPA